jgi:hypothetical protein
MQYKYNVYTIQNKALCEIYKYVYSTFYTVAVTVETQAHKQRNQNNIGLPDDWFYIVQAHQ